MIADWLAGWPWFDASGMDLRWLVWLSWLFVSYFTGLNLLYVALNVVALRLIGRESVHSKLAALPGYSAGLEPGIAIVVPAYNEAATISASVRSLLQLDYPDYEVIVVNDGSKDDTMEVLKREFGLQLFPEAYRVSIPVAPVRGLWRSPQHPHLRVIDKTNGGRSDAVNAGINAAHHGLICAVDADSVLQRDSLRRIARPFMEDSRVIACGGTVRISNGCTIAQGFLQRVDVPSSWLARIQVVEYLRGFLYGRMGWVPVNGLLIISGAFGLFRRASLIEAGGFSTTTIGEDMEMVLRLHRLNRLARRDYRITFAPDAVCWTEAPETFKVLRSQRTRWQRGLMECSWANRQLFFHPRAGVVGWLALPLTLLFEGLGPVIELAGYVVMSFLVLTGLISWAAFGSFLLLAIGMGMMLSASALLLEELAFRTYPKPRHLMQLLAAIVFENIGYRQLQTWWRIVGLAQWATRREQRWGEMARRGSGQPGGVPPS
ncbi:glycosyltransferase [Caldimonas sp. KR1-144]|uniref:glycosyltransferase n=1 Tax=Caldimonas sp. KR1-144 TaxID=3400911 RepID=UPI003C121E2B